MFKYFGGGVAKIFLEVGVVKNLEVDWQNILRMGVKILFSHPTLKIQKYHLHHFISNWIIIVSA